MTEEELAEEFADRARIVDENTRAGDDCISLVQDYEGNVMNIHQRIKTAYLAGYNKANEWHDLRKNPFDLPTHSHRVLVYTDEGVGFGIFGQDNKKWYTYDTGFDVIEWTEILLPE